MRWRGQRQSTNVEDMRGIGGRGMAVGGGIGTLVLLLLAMAAGVDPRVILQQAPQQPAPGQRVALDEREEEEVQFVSTVLADTEDVWHDLFTKQSREYREPKLRLFTGQVSSACGYATDAVGPFYCPADERVYIDLSFYDELQSRFRAPGDFAQAYVIAHEIGHHVQNLLGTSDRVRQLQQRADERESNDLSVRLELQADFYAGVWAHHAQRMRQILEEGDIEEALNAASAIGDDRLQRETRGYVVPDSFTHGTSEQRARWFRKGFESGDMRQGDTFNATRL